MGLQQRSSEQENVQRLSREGVGTSVPKRSAPQKVDEDIVCAAWKHAEVRKRTGAE